MQIKNLPGRIKSNFQKRSSLLHFTSGFTLIELLVVVMTMVLLFGLGLARYRDFSRRKAVERVGIQIRNDLLLIQQYAQSGKKPSDPGCTDPYYLYGWVFKRVDDKNYNIEIDCTGPGGNISDKTVTLPTNGPSLASIRGVTNCTGAPFGIGGNFKFLTLSRGLEDIAASDCVRVRISQDSTNYDILIDSSGAIR